MSCLLGVGAVGGVTCLLTGTPLESTLDPWVGCGGGLGRGGVGLMSCLFGIGVVGGVSCLLAAPAVGSTLGPWVGPPACFAPDP